MKNSTSKRSAGAQFKLKPTMVMAGQATIGALWAVTAAGPAYAQQAAAAPAAAASAPQETPQTVVVTGIRKGIEDAISVKKNADSIVEAISAEDIGKLPDTTIAESLARLPGLTTQRDKSGNATSISIRGLGPDFNGYLLNGREQTSTGDSRAVDLSVYPAELIAGANVYKTSDATLVSAGLAGTIDNLLIQPLNFPGRVVSGTWQKGTTGKGLPTQGHDKRFSLAYIDQFADRKIGLAMGYVKADGTSHEYATGGWGDRVGPVTLTDGTVVDNVKVPTFGNGLDNYKTDRVTDKRDGFAAILQIKPSKEFSTEIDLFHSTINHQDKSTRMQGGLSGPVTNATVATAGDGSLIATSGTLNFGTDPNGLIDRIESIFDRDTIQSIGWRSTWAFSPSWKATVDVNHNTAKRVERDIEAYAGIPGGTDTLTFSQPLGSPIPQFTLGRAGEYTDPNVIRLRDQTGWSGRSDLAQDGYSKGPTVKDALDAVRFDLNKELSGSLFTDVTVGVNLSQRTKDRITNEGVIQSATNNGFDPIAFPSNSYVEHNVGGTGVDLLTFDPTENLWPGAVVKPKYTDDILSKTWSVYENVTTAFTKLNIDTEVGKLPVRGNVGLQLVHTAQASAGFRADVGTDVVLVDPSSGLQRAGTSYNDVLPSLNLSSDLGGGNIIRFGAGVQIARPTLTDMRNSFAVAPNYQNQSCDANGQNCVIDPILVASAGNPYLKPFKAKALDLSYEKYFGTKGYLSGAVFYKKLDSYITTQTTFEDLQTAANNVGITQLPCTVGTVNGQQVPVCVDSWTGISTQTVNGSGGNLKGIELTASAPFSLLSSWLDGLGLTGSYSNTTSSVRLPNVIGLNPNQQVPNDGKSIPLPGLSHINTKLMVYFERWGFSAFIAQNYRSDYVGSVANSTVGGYPTLQYIDAQKWISAQVGYEFQGTFLKGLGIRVEGNNLNKPIYVQHNADGSTTTNKTGASVDLRVSYKF